MKKRIGIILGIIVILVALAVTLFFILPSSSDYDENSTQAIELNGVWLVYQYGADKIDDEFMAFEDQSVIDYRNSNFDEAYATSSFTYSNGRLTMNDISKEFSVKVVSNNNVILTEADTKEWKMIRIADSVSCIENTTSNDIVGTYDVVSVAGEVKSGETMVFTENSFTDVRDGNDYLSSSYTIYDEKHILVADGISKEYIIYKNGCNLLLVDCADRYVWELTKQK